MYVRRRSAVCITVASRLVTSDVLFERVRMSYWPVYICVCVLQGASAGWWNHRHFQHHAKPNVFKKDPDVNMLNAFVVGKVQPVEVQTHYPQDTHMKTLDRLWFVCLCYSTALRRSSICLTTISTSTSSSVSEFMPQWLSAQKLPRKVYRIISWFRS